MIVKLTLPENELICDGKQVSFRSPCECNNFDSIQLNGAIYTLVDARGIPVRESRGQVFCKDSIISVLLDTKSSLAYLQTPAVPVIEIVKW